MRAKGNGTVKTCVGNLLRTWRGEVPYERLKGLDPRLLDQPLSTAAPAIEQDARWLIATYEPRALVKGIDVTQDVAVEGGIVITAKLKGEGVVTVYG